MTRLEIHLDAEALQPIIQAAVEATIHRLQAERPADVDGQVLLGKAGAAEVMSVSASTIDRWRREEGLPYVKLDGLVLFRPDSLKAWSAEKENANST